MLTSLTTVRPTLIARLLAEPPISRSLSFADGPSIPWQKLYRVEDPGALLPTIFSGSGARSPCPFSPADVPVTLTDNAALAERDASYLHADITHSRVMLRDGGAGTGDVEVNVMEIRPPMMDESGRTKYPVLFQVSVSRLIALALPV